MSDENVRDRREMLLKAVGDGDAGSINPRDYTEKLLAEAAEGEETRSKAREHIDLFINDISGAGGGGPDIAGCLELLDSMHTAGGLGTAVRMDAILGGHAKVDDYFAGKNVPLTLYPIFKAALNIFLFSWLSASWGDTDKTALAGAYADMNSAAETTALLESYKASFSGYKTGINSNFAIIDTIGISFMKGIITIFAGE